MNEHGDIENAPITRRRSLVSIGGFLATALGTAGWKAASSDDAEAADTGSGPAGVASGAVTCVLTPEQTEGPYYIANERLRRNITEGHAGVALSLRLTVVNASTCNPIKGAAVDIWHADAAGVYSGFGEGASNRTFLRGMQKTDANGLAIFKTIYPGWYRGRTVHIHVKVHLGGNVVHTGQLYFPDTVTDTIFKRSPYTKRPARDTRNANDSVYVNGGKSSVMRLRKNSSGGYVATLTMGVNRS
jgi:protocatechuate 3,4-dioxygenase beta subunit